MEDLAKEINKKQQQVLQIKENNLKTQAKKHYVLRKSDKE